MGFANNPYEVWISIDANKEILLAEKEFSLWMERLKCAGFDHVILSVKGIDGFGIYKSDIVPHYGLYDPEFDVNKDYAGDFIRIIREKGMKAYVAFDVFAEGYKKKLHHLMKGYSNPGWQCEVYGLDKDGTPRIKKSLEASDLDVVGSIDDFGDIFVNPANPEVREYEINVIKEFVTNYKPDGVVLDRVRYVGLSCDFSELSRAGFADYIKTEDFNWPEDIYTFKKEGEVLTEVFGKYFGKFFEYRALVIKDFILSVSEAVKEANPLTEFTDYTGSWYPLYYQVGANWASSKYISQDFGFCDGETLSSTAYGDIPDRMLSGFYYPDVYIDDAKDKPAYWYSVEGSSVIAKKALLDNRVTGALYLAQYKDCPRRIREAVLMCNSTSEGCMIFDLSHIRNEGCLKYLSKMEYKLLEPKDLDDILEISNTSFPPEFNVTGARLEEKIFLSPEFSKENSAILYLVDGKGKKTAAGFIAVKVSKNRELFPDTAWICALAVHKDYRRCGIGALLLNRAIWNLRKNGIKTVYAGMDIGNLFSGIPGPGEANVSLFEAHGFEKNIDEHYDLEGRLDNPLIDNYDQSHAKGYFCKAFDGDTSKLYEFLDKEFPGRWRMEAEEAINSGRPLNNIYLLFYENDPEIKGFCMVYAPKEGVGGLGPIGISESVRGGRIGEFFLRQSLLHLRSLEVKVVCIDWTILKDFYGRFGFVPVRTYRGATLRFRGET